MSIRNISWYVTKDDEKVAGVEDTGKGWAVVDSKGKVILSVKGYSNRSRLKIMERYKYECDRKTHEG